MRINTNVSSLNAWRNLTGTDGAMGKNLERLSSGYRINRAGDDVAGLAISENMRAQVKGLNQAIKNAQDGISLLQTAEGSLTEVHNMLHRMRELAVQSANGTLQPEDRKQIQTEMDNLTKEVTRITNATQFNSKDLIDGSLQASGIQGVTLQIGPNGGQTVSFEVGAMDAKSLGISRDVLTGVVDNGFDIAAGGGTEIGANIVDSVTEVGAGVTAGDYQVIYDKGTNKIRLFEKDSGGAFTVAVGVEAEFKADETVTIGDVNTAKTVTLKLEGSAPTVPSGSSTVADTLRLGSAVGEVILEDTVVADRFLAATGGVVSVGNGLASEEYMVKFTAAVGGPSPVAATVQLFNKAGTVAIGNAVDIVANGTAEIGDKITGRTVTIKAGSSLATTAQQAQVRITNNEQAAEAARFNGGAKLENAAAFAGLNVSSVQGAQSAIAAIDAAIGKVSYQRSQLGAITNRLDHTINNLSVVSENLTASESRIRDVDMALEMTQFTKQQILMQSGTAMLAQANQKNQAILSLLR